MIMIITIIIIESRGYLTLSSSKSYIRTKWTYYENQSLFYQIDSIKTKNFNKVSLFFIFLF